MDIHSKYPYPSNSLSNFAPHKFTFDKVQFASMEGFMQALKFKTPKTQIKICGLVGKQAKEYGENKNWLKEQTLYWKNKKYKRKSKEYKQLITACYDALFKQNEEFRNALTATKNRRLTHKIGKRQKTKTVLTKKEFIYQLRRLRKKLK